MEVADNFQHKIDIEKLMLRKRKLIELREEIKVKSSFKTIKVYEKDACCSGSVFFIEQLSISPPPFSPLTPLAFKPKQNKLQCNETSFGTIYFKDNLDRESDFKSVNLKKRGRSCAGESFRLNQISEDPLPISAEKKKDIMDLLELIDEVFYNFYKQLKTNDFNLTDPDIDEDDPDLEDKE